MENFSIFSLIRLGDDKDAQNELLIRYNKYNGAANLVCQKSTIKKFLKRLNNILENKELIDIYDLENLTKSLSIKDFEPFEEDLSILSENDFFIQLLCKSLKESFSFQCTYFLIFLSHFVNYDKKNKEFNEIIKIYCTSIFFSYTAINILQKSEEYPLLHHKAYYTFVKKEERTLPFYLSFPNDFDSSYYYKLLHNFTIKESHIPIKVNICNEESKNDFISLLKKHNNSLTSYKEIRICIEDFDSFFSLNNDIFSFINCLKNEMLVNINNYPYLVDFILTLLTRCNNLVTLAFAISCVDFLLYKKEFSRLYKEIEYLAHYESLTQYCLIALQKVKNFQAILRRLFKIDSAYVKFPVLHFIDLKDEQNIRLLLENINHPIIQNAFLDKILNHYSLEQKLNSDPITTTEINLISNLLANYAFYCPSNNLKNFPNIKWIIEELYKNHYHQINNIHFLNATLLNNFDNQELLSKQITSIILEYVIYEDELTYIDEQLSNDNFNIDELSLMMDYYDYCPIFKLVKIFSSNPIKFTKLLFNFNNQELLEDCLNILDSCLKIKHEHLIIDKLPIDYATKDTLLEETYLGFLSSLVEVSPICYPNIYKIGINYFQKDVRYLFYENLINLIELNEIDYSILSCIKANVAIETDEEILKLMNKIINYKKIQVS